MHLTKKTMQKKANRQNLSVVKQPTRRQLNRRNAQTELKAAKINAKNAAWEMNRVKYENIDLKIFQKKYRRITNINVCNAYDEYMYITKDIDSHTQFDF
jgi:hypothetical protein